MTLAALLASLLVGACAGARPPATIRIGTDATYPPFEWIDNNSRQLTGFDIELMTAVAARANLVVNFGQVAFQPLLAGVAACRYDGGISAIEITDARKQQMAFSTPYFTSGQVVVVKKGNLVITGRDKLADMTVGAQQDSPGMDEVQKLTGARLKLYPTADMALDDLINGLIDAVVTEQQRSLAYVETPANNLKTVGGLFAPQSYGIALCSQRPDLLKQINAGLASLKADGTLDRLTQKWMGVSAP